MPVWVKPAAAAVAAAVFALVAVAYMLPGEVTVTRAVEVAAPRATIFALVADLRRFGEWSPWLAGDPDVVITFTGPLDGVGQAMEWASPRREVGSGRQTVTGLEPDREVVWAVAVVGRRPAEMRIGLETDGAATAVTWSLRVDLGASPIARYLGLWVDRTFGPDLERGLVRLKAIAEGLPVIG